MANNTIICGLERIAPRLRQMGSHRLKLGSPTESGGQNIPYGFSHSATAYFQTPMIISPWRWSTAPTLLQTSPRKEYDVHSCNFGGFSRVSQTVGGPLAGTNTTHRSSRKSRRRMVHGPILARVKPSSRRFSHRCSTLQESNTASSSSGYERLSRRQDLRVRGSGGRRSRSKPHQRILS